MNQAHSGKAKILVVDDIAENLLLLENVFAREGFEIDKVGDAHRALEALRLNEYDLAVLDVMMPDVDGFELCRRIKEKQGARFFPVVLITALNDRKSVMTAFECGADHFISKPFDREELVAKVRSLIKLKNLQNDLDHSENIILTLAVALESRDPYTKGHSVRVGELAKMFGEHLGLNNRDQENLRKAGYLHDIGKIAISQQVLCKEEMLTATEMQMVRQHVTLGEEICRPLDSMRTLLRAIRHHHERWDGKGFPDGLSGEEIPVMARILSVADSFDAMVSERPYRRKRSVEEVVQIMNDEKELGQWDPRLVGYFMDMIIPRSREIYLGG